MLKGFKQFVLRGNVVDLAVGVIIGAAFTAVVNSLASDVLTPALGTVARLPDFASLAIGPIRLGNFLNAIVSFLIVAVAVYFGVVVPVNALIARARSAPPADPTTKKCPECLSEVPLQARRCAYCTSPLEG